MHKGPFTIKWCTKDFGQAQKHFLFSISVSNIKECPHFSFVPRRPSITLFFSVRRWFSTTIAYWHGLVSTTNNMTWSASMFASLRHGLVS
jgi:hypothetical protein